MREVLIENPDEEDEGKRSGLEEAAARCVAAVTRK
jgi:hypothetical protein